MRGRVIAETLWRGSDFLGAISPWGEATLKASVACIDWQAAIVILLMLTKRQPARPC
jgi:hypothetical protein